MTLQWLRESEKWLRSACGRYRISRNDLYCETRYTSYAWVNPCDLLPLVIDTVSNQIAAKQLCETNLLYGGSP